jgi:hypothetical protein
VAPRKPTILVVTEDLEPSQAISAWLREAGLRVIGCPGPQPPSYVHAGDAANHARSPLVATWSSSTSGRPATPCCRARPPCNVSPITWTWEGRWWPCNASAALRGRFGVVIGVDRGGQAAALAERGAHVVVADLGELALQGGPVRRGHR